MFRPTKTFLLPIMTVMIYSSYGSAAIFEVQHLVTSTTAPATRLHAIGSQAGRLSQAASIDRGSDWQFPSGKLGLAKPEDLLWVEIGDTSLSGLQHSLSNADTALYSIETKHFLAQTMGHGSAVRAPTEGTAPEIWAVILIGAGLILSQLRRKSLHGAIRFTAPQ
jgi:hypothetical protein